MPLVMPAGNTERNRIEELGLGHLFGDRFRLVDKQPYARFMPLLARANFVVTDSGGLQQECGILGKPAAIHREAVESQQGIGDNLVLTGLDMERPARLPAHWASYARPSLLDAVPPHRGDRRRAGAAGHSQRDLAPLARRAQARVDDAQRLHALGHGHDARRSRRRARRRGSPPARRASGSRFWIAKRVTSPSLTPAEGRHGVPVGLERAVGVERQVAGQRVGDEGAPLAGDDASGAPCAGRAS